MNVETGSVSTACGDWIVEPVNPHLFDHKLHHHRLKQTVVNDDVKVSKHVVVAPLGGDQNDVREVGAGLAARLSHRRLPPEPPTVSLPELSATGPESAPACC